MMQKYEVPIGSLYPFHGQLLEDAFKRLQEKAEVYLASDVDARIAELAKIFVRWLPIEIANDVTSKELPNVEGFSPDYLNDLADMRAAFFLMVK